jgi:hypothetical protein
MNDLVKIVKTSDSDVVPLIERAVLCVREDKDDD